MKGEVRTGGVDERGEEEEEHRASRYGPDSRPQPRHLGAERRRTGGRAEPPVPSGMKSATSAPATAVGK
jgi:hypothetical protein